MFCFNVKSIYNIKVLCLLLHNKTLFLIGLNLFNNKIYIYLITLKRILFILKCIFEKLPLVFLWPKVAFYFKFIWVGK